MKSLVPLLLLTAAAMSSADSSKAPAAKLSSKVYDWQQLVPTPTANGVRRDVFDGPTLTLDKMHCHITTLNPGKDSGEPRKHLQEEVLIVKEGLVEAHIDGNLTKLKQLTIEIEHEQSCDFIIPPNVKHLYLNFYQFTHYTLGVQWSNGDSSNLISLRIDNRCSGFNYFDIINVNIFEGLGSLCRLEIGKTEIPWRSFKHLTSLTHFKCVNWEGMPDYDAFKSLVNLKTLYLNRCHLKELPANIFVHQKQLETLILEDNWLNDLNRKAFNGLESLKVLNVKSNDLSEFNLIKLNGIL
ncbi:MAG: leucine-rich repeat protein [Ignavibacteriae bacterium]|nr:leucine-rich repeat protein [Ignavibacteriota bacterium]